MPMVGVGLGWVGYRAAGYCADSIIVMIMAAQKCIIF